MEEMAKALNEYLLQVAENLPLFEQFNLKRSVLNKNLTVQEIHTIALIGRLDSPKMSQVAERAHVTMGTMTVMVNKLVRKGYVRRSRPDKDKRVVRVSLTAKGARVEKLHEEYHSKTIARIMTVLEESEQKQLLKLMQKVVAALG
ncbi:MarR family transcriptional regulator [Candidatus Poribacteria bacterium]|nr:MarR family transcriptional regulator [Candidatus Poribacteria bacterium]